MCVCAYVCVFLHGIHWIMGFIPVCWRHKYLGSYSERVLTCLHTLLLICIPGFPRCCGLNCQILRLLKSPCSPISCKIWWVESPFSLLDRRIYLHRITGASFSLVAWVIEWTEQISNHFWAARASTMNNGCTYYTWHAKPTCVCVCVLRRTSFHLGVSWTWGSYISLWVCPWNIMEFPVTWDMLRAFHHAAFGSCSTW